MQPRTPFSALPGVRGGLSQSQWQNICLSKNKEIIPNLHCELAAPSTAARRDCAALSHTAEFGAVQTSKSAVPVSLQFNYAEFW